MNRSRNVARTEKKIVTYEVVLGGLSTILAVVLSFVAWGRLREEKGSNNVISTGPLNALLATAILQVVLLLVLITMLITHELRESWYYLIFGGPFVNAVVSWHVDFTAGVPLIAWYNYTVAESLHPVTFRLLTTSMTFSLLFAGFVKEQLYFNKAEYYKNVAQYS